MEYFIESISINKIRHLENLKIDISNKGRKHLILTGKNGSGKTTVLHNISIYLKSIEDGNYLNIEGLYLRYLNDYKAEYEKLLKKGISIHDASLNNIKSSIDQWEKLIKTYNNGIYVDVKNKQYVESAYQKNEFIIAYFDAKRSTTVHPPKNIKNIELKEKFNIHENVESIFLDYLVFLKTQQSFANNEGDLEEVNKIKNWFDRFENALRKILEDDSINLKFNYRDLTFKICQNNREPYGFEVLSDGYSAILDIFINLILRMEKHTKNSYDIQGIVMIDELETHLHIKLQKSILRFLTEFFPNIQFIITTHSPFIINSIDNAVIYDLENNQRVENLSSYPYESVVEGYFNIDTYSKTIKDKLNQYKELVYKLDKNEEEKQLEYELQKELKNASNDLTPDLSIEFNKVYQERRESLLNKSKKIFGDQFEQIFNIENKTDDKLDGN